MTVLSEMEAQPLVETYVQVLKTEVLILKSRLQPEDTGHLHTTIRVLEERIEEIKENAYKEFVSQNPA